MKPLGGKLTNIVSDTDSDMVTSSGAAMNSSVAAVTVYSTAGPAIERRAHARERRSKNQVEAALIASTVATSTTATVAPNGQS